MKVTYLGHSGLLFEKENCKIIIDPFLAETAEDVSPFATRRFPPNPAFFKKHYNVVIVTHAHPDHYDKATLSAFFKTTADTTILCPSHVYNDIMEIAGNNKCIMFNPGTSYTILDVVFTATYAEHTEEQAIGVFFRAQGSNYYITGDTLYNEKVFRSVPDEDIRALFVPINGAGNNMNYYDAARFAVRMEAKKVVPIHFGLFDDYTGNEIKLAKPKVKGLVIPKPFEEIKI